MYEASRELGMGLEVKRRVIMGTYALSAGYYDAFYKRAQQVRDLLSPPAVVPAAAYLSLRRQMLMGLRHACHLSATKSTHAAAYQAMGGSC